MRGLCFYYGHYLEESFPENRILGQWSLLYIELIVLQKVWTLETLQSPEPAQYFLCCFHLPLRAFFRVLECTS